MMRQWFEGKKLFLPFRFLIFFPPCLQNQIFSNFMSQLNPSTSASTLASYFEFYDENTSVNPLEQYFLESSSADYVAPKFFESVPFNLINDPYNNNNNNNTSFASSSSSVKISPTSESTIEFFFLNSTLFEKIISFDFSSTHIKPISFSPTKRTLVSQYVVSGTSSSIVTCIVEFSNFSIITQDINTNDTIITKSNKFVGMSFIFDPILVLNELCSSPSSFNNSNCPRVTSSVLSEQVASLQEDLINCTAECGGGARNGNTTTIIYRTKVVYKNNINDTLIVIVATALVTIVVCIVLFVCLGCIYSRIAKKTSPIDEGYEMTDSK